MKQSCLRLKSIVYSTVFFLSLVASASSAVPTTISYQGRLTGADGTPVSDGDYSVTFSLYDVAIGGEQFWSETHAAVGVTDGLFQVLLGSVTPFGVGGAASPAKAGEDAWLSISVNGGPESDPRIPMVSVPFAFQSHWADSAGFAMWATRTDSANFSNNSNNSIWSDTAGYTHGSMWSDTAGYASGSMWSDSSFYAFSSGWADTSDHAMSVADGSINNASIAEGSVDSRSIADGSIALSDIGTNGATNGQIMKWNIASGGWVVVDDNAGSGGIIAVLPGSGLSGGGSTPVVTLDVADEGITSAHIGAGAVRNSELAINAVAAENIQPQVIDYTKIAINTITGDRIANKTIGGGDIADSTIGWQQLKPNAVVSSRIAPNTIDTSDIATDGVGSDEIVDGSITGADIEDGAVGSTDIANGAIQSNHIAPNAIGPSHYQPESVTSNALAAFSVRNSELQSGAVTSSKILDGTITSSDLATSSVDSAAIAPYAVGSSELAPDAVQSYHVSNGAITDTKLADNAVHSGKVFDGSLVAVDLGDEPGIASFTASSWTTAPDTFHVMGTQTIGCPTAGYLLATGTMSVLASNGQFENSELIYHLTLDHTVDAGFGELQWEPTGIFQTQLPLHSVFPVSSGSHLVEVFAKNDRLGIVYATGVSLTLIFIPTAYGSIAAPSKSGESNRLPESQY